MTLQEAIKTGQPFRRASWTDSPDGYKYYVHLDPYTNKLYLQFSDGTVDKYSISDVEVLLATDWEAKEQRINLTSSEVKQAVMKYLDINRDLDDLVKALGFTS